MKPVEQDEMFPEGASTTWEPEDVVTTVSLNPIDVAGTERAIHADFNNHFGDLFDDDDLE